MLKIVIFFLFLTSNVYADEWTSKDTGLELVYLGVNAADLASSWSVTKMMVHMK